MNKLLQFDFRKKENITSQGHTDHSWEQHFTAIKTISAIQIKTSLAVNRLLSISIKLVCLLPEYYAFHLHKLQLRMLYDWFGSV